MTDEWLDELTERIIGRAIEVHKVLGPGLLESVYRECLILELRSAGLGVTAERFVHVTYKEVPVSSRLRIDLVVCDAVVVELKAVDRLHPVFIAQLITYLKLSNYPAGLILNFNVPSLRNGIRRVDHPDRYKRKTPPRM